MEALRAYLEYPDMLPRQRLFHVQGWALAPAPILGVDVVGSEGAAEPLALRARPDVARTFPDTPFSTGFYGVVRAPHVPADALRLRFRTEDGDEERTFPLAPESQAMLELRLRKVVRVFPHLVCIDCKVGFPETEPGWGMREIVCPGCGKAYGCAEAYFDFLPDDVRAALTPTSEGNISANHYDATAMEFIHAHRDGLVLDCGAGLRLTEYPHVVNLEVVPYRSTDVLAVNERLPFADATFDGVLSLAVLEHVKNPFACAKEICRVLKPGGQVLAVVPLLAPVHAYPDHFYNMTSEGLLNLFTPEIEVVERKVPESGLPIWALTWILRSWAEALPPETRDAFLRLRVADLLGEGPEYLERDFVKQLPQSKNFELAGTTLLLGRRRG